MTYNELIKTVAKTSNFTQNDTKVLIDALRDVMVDALVDGDTIPLKDFGRFSIATHAARAGHNPRTGEEIQIPEKTAVKFRPSTSLKAAVNA